MAYSSPIRLPIGETPTSTDRAYWHDMNDVYASIHILNQLVNQVREESSSGGPEKEIWESLKFTRWFYQVAEEDINVGNIVTVVRGQFRNESNSSNINLNGVVKGAPFPAGDMFSNPLFFPPKESIGTGLVGVALEDCAKGEKCKVGIGPAVLKITGVKTGDLILAPTVVAMNRTGFPLQGRTILNTSRGAISRVWINNISMVAIGSGIGTDAALIYPMVDYWSTEMAKYGISAAAVPVGPGSEA